MGKVILETIDLVTEFPARRRLFRPPKPALRAVDKVSLKVCEGEILGIVGESGSGKSTFAKTILGLLRETDGQILLNGHEVSGVTRREARKLRAEIQYVHQDPGAALDPWWSIGRILRESLAIYGTCTKSQWDERIDAMLRAVGLDESFKRRYPHELSGGQQRRIGIARTLILNPRIVILDEPTSGLDLSIQKTVLDLMYRVRREFNLTYLFISHDLSVVRNLCDRVAIMCRGEVVEEGRTGEIFAAPRHAYTRALLAAVPNLFASPGKLTDDAP